MRRASFHSLACFVAVATLSIAGCSGGGDRTDGGCASSGSTTASAGGSSSITSQAITGIVTSKQGCLDDVRIILGAGVGPWTAAYVVGEVLDARGAAIATGADTNLVVSFAGGAWKGAGSSPTTILPIQLEHVRSINVAAGPNDALLVVLGLDAKLPYTASESDKPAQVSLTIG